MFFQFYEDGRVVITGEGNLTNEHPGKKKKVKIIAILGFFVETSKKKYCKYEHPGKQTNQGEVDPNQ